MSRGRVASVAVVAVALTIAPAQAAPPLQLPALTRIASQLSGLAAKRPVTVVRLSQAAIDRRARAMLDRDYPRDQQAYDEKVYSALGLLGPGADLRPALVATYGRAVRGLYDPVSRRLYVRNTADVRATMVHELVHALQDQAFDLRRLSSLRRGHRDAGLAALAAVEGSTMLFTDPLTRRLQSHGGSRIALFLALEAEFAYATGLRFAATLKNLGGNTAVHASLRRFPTTTEQIFHVDAYLSSEGAERVDVAGTAAAMELERSDSFGELDVRALLAIYQVPRLDHVGEGWAGGRTAVYRDGAGGEAVAIVLSWESERDALEWREAVHAFVNEAFHADTPGAPPATACASDACWSVGPQVAFTREGARTALVIGRNIAQAAALARTLAR